MIADEGTSTNAPTIEPLTFETLRKLVDQIPDYALLTAQPAVEGNDCLMMRRNEFMPPGCRYVLIVAPERLHSVARHLGAHVSSRLVGGNFYEFYVPKEKRERWYGMLADMGSIT